MQAVRKIPYLEEAADKLKCMTWNTADQKKRITGAAYSAQTDA